MRTFPLSELRKTIQFIYHRIFEHIRISTCYCVRYIFDVYKQSKTKEITSRTYESPSDLLALVGILERMSFGYNIKFERVGDCRELGGGHDGAS